MRPLSHIMSAGQELVLSSVEMSLPKAENTHRLLRASFDTDGPTSRGFPVLIKLERIHVFGSEFPAVVNPPH